VTPTSYLHSRAWPNSGDLIAEAGQGELIVNLTIKGEARLLSPTLEVSAYRVIQEAADQHPQAFKSDKSKAFDSDTG